MAFASEGAKVVLGDIDATRGERIAQEIDDGRRGVTTLSRPVPMTGRKFACCV
jgi:hypothetical protein